LPKVSNPGLWISTGTMKKAFFLSLFAAALAALFTVFLSLPSSSNPLAPASVHVSSRYAERGVQETGISNLTAAVLADYRGFDLFLLSFMLLGAGLTGAWAYYEEESGKSFSKYQILLGLGSLLSLGVGLTCVLNGSNFLDYESLPLPLASSRVRAGGAMLLVLGVLLGLLGVRGFLKKSLEYLKEHHPEGLLGIFSRSHFLKKIVVFNLFQAGLLVILFSLALHGSAGSASPLGSGPSTTKINPLPLSLFFIVGAVSLAVSSALLVLAARLHRKFGAWNENEISGGSSK
jgi:multisubunit Na+/H+ antiporter MnhC subunit